jgi:flagellar biogenesis protein FliO
MLAPGVAPTPAARTAPANIESPRPVVPPSASDLGASLLKVVAGLAVMCGACVLIAKLVRPKPPGPSGTMEPVASIAVGPCVLHLVRAGDRRLLVGTDPAGVKAVLELPGLPPELPLETAAAEAPAGPEPEPPAATQAKLLNLLLQLRAQNAARPSA